MVWVFVSYIQSVFSPSQVVYKHRDRQPRNMMMVEQCDRLTHTWRFAKHAWRPMQGPIDTPEETAAQAVFPLQPAVSIAVQPKDQPGVIPKGAHPPSLVHCYMGAYSHIVPVCTDPATKLRARHPAIVPDVVTCESFCICPAARSSRACNLF